MAVYEPLDWYEQALYYDIVFDADTPAEADFLEAMHRRHGRGEGRRVLEPACGTGRLVVELARRGYEVSGFDLAEGSLAYARRRLAEAGLEAKVYRDRLESFEAPAGGFDMAHCLVSTFKYLLTEEDARAHLQRVADALAPGGVYILGVHTSAYEERRIEHERWVAERDGVHVTCNIHSWPPDPATRTEKVRSRLTVRREEGEERYETSWTFRTYSQAELLSLLASVPELEHVATYDFTYDASEPLGLEEDRLDNILILKKRE